MCVAQSKWPIGLGGDSRGGNKYIIPFGGNGDLFSAQASPPKTFGVVRGLLNNHQK